MADTERQLDERGVVLTQEGRERARRQLADLDAPWTAKRRRAAHETFLARLDAFVKLSQPNA